MNNNNQANSKKVILIDIRNSDEAFEKHFDGNVMNNFYNIPMNMIQFNKEVILNHLEYVDEILLVCRTGKRSKFIKDKYFKNVNEVKVAPKKLQFASLNQPGSQTIYLDENTPLTISIKGTFAFNMYNITRIIQVVMGMIILICGGYILMYGKCKPKIPLYIIMFFGANALFNGLTNTCTLTLLLKDYLN